MAAGRGDCPENKIFSELESGANFFSTILEGKRREFKKLHTAYQVGVGGRRSDFQVKNAVCLNRSGHLAGELVFFADGMSVETA